MTPEALLDLEASVLWPRDDQDQPYELWSRQNWALFCTECALLSAPSNPELLRAEWNRGAFRRFGR